MNRVLGRCLAGLVIATGAISLNSACAHDDSSFFVQAVIFPQPQGAGTQCTYTNNPSQIFLSRGTLDTAFRSEYDGTFLVADQLVTESNPNQVQTETSNINIQGAIVRVTDAAGNQLDNFTSLTSGTVYAAVGGTPGYGVAQATLISQNALKAAGVSANGGSKTLVSYTKFFGHTLGGDYIESNEFEFPVDVCYGCLVQFSSADINCQFLAPNCANAEFATASSMSLSTTQTIPCIFGQDTTIDCSQCLAYSVCTPPHVANPTGACTPLDAGGG
jgi:hypothetical protein